MSYVISHVFPSTAASVTKYLRYFQQVLQTPRVILTATSTRKHGTRSRPPSVQASLCQAGDGAAHKQAGALGSKPVRQRRSRQDSGQHNAQSGKKSTKQLISKVSGGKSLHLMQMLKMLKPVEIRFIGSCRVRVMEAARSILQKMGHYRDQTQV